MRIAFQKQGLRRASGFDLSEPDTYYTRPMSPPWSKPLELERLADSAAEVEFSVPLAQLAQLREVRPAVTGEVHGQVRFGRTRDFATAQLHMQGHAVLECQRCMRPMELPLAVATHVALIGAEADAARVPDEFEPVLAAGGRVSIGELVTEELLLSLPIVALHEGSADCAAAPEVTPEQAGETHKPFARLGELMKR